MKQQAQVNLMIGIGAGIVALAAAAYGISAFLNKENTDTRHIPAPVASAPVAADYSAAVNAVAENAGAGTGLTEDEAKRIGEEVARKVAEQVARSVVEQSQGGAAVAASGEGLSEADARRIGAEEGRRAAQEVTATMLQNASASASASGDGGGMTAAEAEQIGLAAGRRAAKQVAADTARNVVRTEFGGTVAAKTVTAAHRKPANEKPAGKHALPPDALKAWWTTPADGTFGLVYAGQQKGERTIALLFSDKPGEAALRQSIKVYNIQGTLVSGAWTTASNPRQALLRKLKPGRYTVVIDASFVSASGKAISKGLHGPVYIQ